MYGCIMKQLKLHSNVLLYDQNSIRSFSEIFGYLQKSLAIFRNLCEMPGNVCLALRNLFENLWKFSESGRKSSENYQKQCH